LAANHQEWATHYVYNPKKNDFTHQNAEAVEKAMVKSWFI
jgi:hypothetical protein